MPAGIFPCPNCGKNVAEEARYCLNCGEPLFSIQAEASDKPQVGYPCPYCDVTVSPAARFCPICGHKLSLPGKTRQWGNRRGQAALSVDEKSLLDYLQQHDYRIKLSEAGKSLGISARRTRLLLLALQNKRLIAMRRTFIS